MTAKKLKTDKGFDFTKKNKVSIWTSQHPYADIPDEYFEERFSKNKTRANNTWSDNYELRFFNPELMETNGSHEGMIKIEQAAGECSFSKSFIQNLMNKAHKKNQLQISWIILLYEYEYSAKLTDIKSDEYTTYLGAFNYDNDADSLIEINEDDFI
ncbi:immunity 22 family protein [Aliikangiella sp. IMCC44359]|uniref:immunity 22 family protein n=1 Tax=Aliikangiella sp. IMCC44359 TaxID=3459125 RepID=UPI00403ACD59